MNKVLTFTIYALLALIILISANLVRPIYKRYIDAQKEVSELNYSLDRSKAEYLAIQQEVHDLEHKSSAIEKLAREKFHLCRDGEIVYIYNE